MDDQKLLSSPSKHFRPSKQPQLTCHDKIVAGICVCTEAERLQREEGSREGGETKWQEACSASMKSDWRTDGPTGEEVVLLSVRLEY